MLMCVTAPPYSEILAANVRAARARLHISQARLAKRMTALGYKWTRQTVSEVEANDRRLLAEEAFALGFCLLTPVPFLLLSAPEFDRRATLPAGYVVELPHTIQMQPGAAAAGPGFWDGDTPAITPEESQKAADPNGGVPQIPRIARDA
jgi:transcriptional regulator with XRE-family HTH domain